eukprot:scaffold1570_cov218-Chaetoceros_neogracile.AAC.6
MMKLPSLIRSATNVAKQPIKTFFNLKPAASLASSYSTLQRTQTVNVNYDVNANVKQPNDILKIDDNMRAAVFHRIITEQSKINDIITSIQALQVNADKTRVKKEEEAKLMNVITMPITEGILQALNRSARNPKRANRGKRPVCRTARRRKKRRWGNHRR